MLEGLPKTKKISIRPLAAIGATLISSGLFLLIPLTQTLNTPGKEIVEYRTVIKSLLPPPPDLVPPTDTPQELEVDIVRELPKMENPVEEIPVHQLELSLAPGIGVALTMGLPNMPMVEKLDIIADIERVFNFDELIEIPTLLNSQMIRADFPTELKKRGVKEATIILEILIDKTGKVRVNRILSSSYNHPKLVEAAKKAASQARFSVTKVKGQPVRVRGRFPITLRAPR